MFTWHDTTWMWVSMLVIWAGIALIAVYAVKAWGESWRRPTTPERHRVPAADVLAERFARGEISAEEYRDRRRTLERSDEAPPDDDAAAR